MTVSLSKLGLGTAQFGLDQPPGPRGRPRDAEARDILSIAGRSGLSVLEVPRQPPNAAVAARMACTHVASWTEPDIFSISNDDRVADTLQDVKGFAA